jgi:DNA-directed RNA polymerase specialized sigma24 family protein
MPWFQRPSQPFDTELNCSAHMALAIRSLPDELQTAVRLRRVESLTVAQTAERLGLTEQETLRLLARAMARITMHLGEQERAAQAKQARPRFRWRR